MNRVSKTRKPLLLLGAALFLNGALFAVAPPSTPQQAAPDNTQMNKGEAQEGATTADQQGMNPSDREITRKIRSMIVDDESLSTYAHNIKVITQGGKVTLKGLVRTQKEKVNVEAKAGAVAGPTNVTSAIQIAPSKP